MEDSVDSEKLGERKEESSSPPGNPKQNDRVIVTRSKTNKLASAKQLPSFSYETNLSNYRKKNKAVAKKRSYTDVDDEEVTKPPPAKKKKSLGISEYELQVQKNIEERKKLFEMLNFGDAKQELLDVIPNKRKRKLDEVKEDHDENSVPIKRGRPAGATGKPKAKVVKKKSLPVRASLRERKTTRFYDYLHVNESLVSSATDSSVSESSMMDVSNESLLEMCNEPCRMRLRSRRNHGDGIPIRTMESPMKVDLKSVDEPTDEAFFSEESDATLTLKNTYVDQSSVDESADFVRGILPFLQNGDSDERVSIPNDLQEFVQLMKTLELSDDGIASLSSGGRSRITSMAWHPNPERFILASANVFGTIGFWDIDHESDNRTSAYDVHTSHVTGLSFDRYNPSRIFSTGRDGFVRLLDFRSEVFDEIHNTSEMSKVAFPICHIQKDSSSLIVARADGQVVTIDTRLTPTIGEQKFKCFNGKIVSLSHHPLNENLIMASSVNGEIGVFDLRNVQTKSSDVEEVVDPVIRFPLIGSRISGSFFSPLSGKNALITGKNIVEVYDLHAGSAKSVQNWNSTLSQRNSVLGNAIWHPLRDEVCLATKSDGSIEMLSVPDCEILHCFKEREIFGSPVVNVFHPSAPVLASGCNRIYLHRPNVSG
uniref:WD repeat-containing protein 76 n=1 Tax=Daphnia galeata TaxID=27404 RepID=A0A8J2WQR3_9CRUS|nr:unnamed protein product [Daphnia galeata]